MKNLYINLPYYLQAISTNIYGYFLERKRYPRVFNSILEYYRVVEKDEVFNLDIEKVAELVKESSYYNIKDKADFFATPIITKDILRRDYEKIINPARVDSYLNTGGTTGSGFKFPVSKEFIYHQWAIYWKFRYIHGMSRDTWCAYIMGKSLLNNKRNKPPYWIRSYSTKQLLLSLSHLNKKTVELYLQEIKRSNIKWIHAYPSTLNLLAGLIQDRNLEELAKSLNLDLITTGSEMLLGYQKTNIENIFGCKVRQLYGLTEGVASIFECEQGSLHVDETYSYVEFIREEGNSNHYKIVGTLYYNKAFPLVRYDTGDSVLLYDTPVTCSCGRKSRVVKEIIGREQDFLMLEDNTKVVRIGIIFREAYNIKKTQIIQREKGHAEFYIVKGPNYGIEDERNLIHEIISLLGPNFKYEIIYTDKLRVSESGKVRFVINELESEKPMSKTQFKHVQ